MRIVFWNIRAGGGCRVDAIVEHLEGWEADVVALCEFRATPPSLEIARRLATCGLAHQHATADPRSPSANGLLVAARWPLSRVRSRSGPREPGRWLLTIVGAPEPLALGAMHVPNRVTGRKYIFHDAVLALVRRWRRGPAVLLGDTNSGHPGIDEEVAVFGPREADWLRALDGRGWVDAFRHLHGDRRAYTWYSPNGGNGFRIDQAFVNAGLRPRLRATRYEWARPPGARAAFSMVSDHAALLVDLDREATPQERPAFSPRKWERTSLA